MKEILRIRHGMQKRETHNILRDYNLEVYEGEIVYIQGLSGSGLTALLHVLKGEAPLDEGVIYIDEKPVENYHKHSPIECGIYIITEKQDLVGNLTVAENLEVLQKGRRLHHLYNRKTVAEKVDGYLWQQGLAIPSDTLVRNLSSEDCQKLSIIKARMHGAKLIVLDCTKGYYEGRFAREMTRMLRRISTEGISFIILSEQMSVFAEIADRVQLILHGKDIMEWNYVNRSILEHEKLSETDLEGKLLEGFFDYDWEIDRNLWNYLYTVKENNEAFWTENIHMETLPEGCYYQKQTVLIPKDSALGLVDSMDIRMNATLAIKERISGSPIGYISNRLVDNITAEFYQMTGIDCHVKYPSELTYVERKILSIYRWEIAKPKIMFLESPCWGMDLKDSNTFYRYLLHLVEKGIRIVCFSKSLSELKMYCNKIIVTENGCNAALLVDKG